MTAPFAGAACEVANCSLPASTASATASAGDAATQQQRVADLRSPYDSQRPAMCATGE
jgi:hypothetical protein